MKKIMLIAVAALPFLFSGCDDDDKKGQEAPPAKVSGPIKQKLTEWDEYTGRFRAFERVEIRARVSGYLDEIRFKDGQLVKKGDTLFVIDQRPFQIALERAEAQFELSTKEYDRYRQLRKTSAASQQALDERYQQLRDAKASLDHAKLEMEFTEIKSPIDGRVSRHLVDIGNLVSGGDTGAMMLTTVVAEKPVQFYFEVSEQEILKYTRLDREGKRESSRTLHRPVFVKLQDEKDFVHEGRMDFVDNEVDRETGTLLGRAIFDNEYGSLIPGLFGRLRIAGSGEYEAMLLPDNIIGTNQSQKFVYVVNAENTVEQRPVVLGPLYDNDMRIIRDGVKDGDKIIMEGIMKIRPGMKVKPEAWKPPAPKPVVMESESPAKPASWNTDETPVEIKPEEGPVSERPAQENLDAPKPSDDKVIEAPKPDTEVKP